MQLCFCSSISFACVLLMLTCTTMFDNEQAYVFICSVVADIQCLQPVLNADLLITSQATSGTAVITCYPGTALPNRQMSATVVCNQDALWTLENGDVVYGCNGMALLFFLFQMNDSNSNAYYAIQHAPRGD